MPDTTPDVLDLYTAVESGEEPGDRTAFLDALDARDAAVRTAAIREAATELDRIADEREAQAIEEDGRAYGGSNKTVAAYRDMAAHLRDLASAPAAAAPTPKEG